MEMIDWKARADAKAALDMAISAKKDTGEAIHEFSIALRDHATAAVQANALVIEKLEAVQQNLSADITALKLRSANEDAAAQAVRNDRAARTAWWGRWGAAIGAGLAAAAALVTVWQAVMTTHGMTTTTNVSVVQPRTDPQKAK